MLGLSQLEHTPKFALSHGRASLPVVDANGQHVIDCLQDTPSKMLNETIGGDKVRNESTDRIVGSEDAVSDEKSA